MVSRLAEWTIIACFPAGIFVLLGVFELPAFVDPCHSWAEGAPQATQAPPSSGECIGRTSTAETKGQAATRLLLFQGTTLIGMAIALVGAVRMQRLLIATGAGLLAAISVPLMLGLSFVFPLVSALLLGVGLLMHRPAPSETLPRR